MKVAIFGKFILACSEIIIDIDNILEKNNKNLFGRGKYFNPFSPK